MERYNIETLKKMNAVYNMEHGVTQSDADKANMYVALIESSRNDNRPMPGDVVRFTDKHGDYYENAHIERVNARDKEVYICEQPYVPFIRPSEKGISCNTSGGAWTYIPIQLKRIGKQQKAFCDWGHCGACGNGAIHFRAEVNVWEYIAPDALYGEFSTKNWRKMYVSYCSEHDIYQYFSDGTAWKNKNELDRFVEKYKGVVFNGHSKNQSVVWCYREQTVRVSLEEFEKLDLPNTTILLNGLKPAKMRVDDANKTIIHYANW